MDYDAWKIAEKLFTCQPMSLHNFNSAELYIKIDQIIRSNN